MLYPLRTAVVLVIADSVPDSDDDIRFELYDSRADAVTRILTFYTDPKRTGVLTKIVEIDETGESRILVMTLRDYQISLRAEDEEEGETFAL